jgi:hypothetical protein
MGCDFGFGKPKWEKQDKPVTFAKRCGRSDSEPASEAISLEWQRHYAYSKLAVNRIYPHIYWT